MTSYITHWVLYLGSIYNVNWNSQRFLSGGGHQKGEGKQGKQNFSRFESFKGFDRLLQRENILGRMRVHKAPDSSSRGYLSLAVGWQQCYEHTSSYYWIPQKRRRSHKSAKTLGNRSMLYHRGKGQKEYQSTYIYEVTSLDHEILYYPKEVKQHLVPSGQKPQEAQCNMKRGSALLCNRS